MRPGSVGHMMSLVKWCRLSSTLGLRHPSLTHMKKKGGKKGKTSKIEPIACLVEAQKHTAVTPTRRETKKIKLHSTHSIILLRALAAFALPPFVSRHTLLLLLLLLTRRCSSFFPNLQCHSTWRVSEDPDKLARVPLQAILLADSFTAKFRLERPKAHSPPSLFSHIITRD